MLYSNEVGGDIDELQKKGIKSNLNDIENEIANRDKIDSTRAASPLKPAEDSIIIDTSFMTIEEQIMNVWI